MKKILLIICLPFISHTNYAFETKDSSNLKIKIHLGSNGGITSHNLLNTDVYAGAFIITKNNGFIELNAGFNFNSNKA